MELATPVAATASRRNGSNTGAPKYLLGMGIYVAGMGRNPPVLKQV